MKLNERKPKTEAPTASNKGPVQRDGRTRRPMQRIYEIHARIRSGALPNCTTLALNLEVDRKTIQRDITFMRDATKSPSPSNSASKT